MGCVEVREIKKFEVSEVTQRVDNVHLAKS